jgi:hypothetical protein
MDLNKGDGVAMPKANPIPFPPPAIPPTPFNVERDPRALINTNDNRRTTQETNGLYRQALQSRNTIWQFYQLVMTQWPTSSPPNADVPPEKPGTINNTFPGTGAQSAFANVTMETFEQKSVRTGCMNCHTTVQNDTDFLWSLEFNAFPPPPEGGIAPMVANAEAAHNRVSRAVPQSLTLPTLPSIARLKQLLRAAAASESTP